MDLKTEDLNNLIEFIRKKLDPLFIVVFGSAAKGSLKADSDIDVGFYSDATFCNNVLFEISGELAAMLGKDIDLIDIKKASTVFRFQILSTGKIVYSKNEEITKTFKIMVFKDYCKLNEERKEIIGKVMERGAVYE